MSEMTSDKRKAIVLEVLRSRKEFGTLTREQTIAWIQDNELPLRLWSVAADHDVLVIVKMPKEGGRVK